MSERTPEQIANLQNLIKANRESEKRFDMDYYGKEESCGTACCALGNYAMRTDLQKHFSLVFPHENARDNSAQLMYSERNYPIGVYSAVIQDHFGILPGDCENLFSTDGMLSQHCSSAQDAADFIEKYIGERQ